MVTLDMGGTSTDVSLIRAGEPEVTSGGSLGGYPLSIPMLGINYIGAGGGSIAWLDPGGILRVGPRSAGAAPGTGVLRPRRRRAHGDRRQPGTGAARSGARAGRQHRARRRRGRRRSIERLGRRLEMPPLQVALGIVRVANANMIRAIRGISVDRGHDLREFALIAFGGAGPLHAGRLALELSIPRVIVPPQPGVLSALGLLVAGCRAPITYGACCARST